MTDWSSIDNYISAYLQKNFNACQRTSMSGGCINQAWCLTGKYNAFFVKLNQSEHLEMFIAEYDGLEILAASQAIRVPKPIGYGIAADQAFLIMEYIPLNHPLRHELLGEQLAQLHQHTATEYGWKRDNYIGLTPQINHQHTDWRVFWRDNRLAYQLQQAAKNGYAGELQALGEQLLDNLHHLFEGYTVQASLLHGDLWAGNAGGSENGSPVIFDPAVYYGDRETDLAMTELFGGFTPNFYAAYNQVWPLDKGYNVRKYLYNLYHLLNHLNLFGSSYLAQCIQVQQRLLAEIK